MANDETFKPGSWHRIEAQPSPHQVLIDYLIVKVGQADWHAVRDAAVDLELLELRLSLDGKVAPNVNL